MKNIELGDLIALGLQSGLIDFTFCLAWYIGQVTNEEMKEELSRRYKIQLWVNI